MRLVTRVALVAALVALHLAQAGESPAPAGISKLAWRELEFTTRKLLLSASTTVAVTLVGRDQVALRATPRGDGRAPRHDRLARITTRTDLPFGRREETTTVVDAVTGEWMETDKLVRGHGDYGKTMRATTGGAYVWRVAPRDEREGAASPAGWTRRKESALVVPPMAPPELVVTDPYALLYLISQAGLGVSGGSRSWLLLSPEGGLRVDVAAGALRRVRVSFQRSWGGGGWDRVRREVSAREVIVAGTAVPGPDGRDGPQLELLGLRGNLRVLVDAVTNLPLEIRGRSETLGDVTVRLARVELETAPHAGPGE